MSGIKKYLADVDKIAVGSSDIIKINKGTTAVWAASTDIVCNPNVINTIAGMPYTTVNIDCDKAGTLYVEEASGPSGYFELEWYKNNTYQGYLVVWSGSGYDLGPGSITVAAGDDIKFRVGTGTFATWRMRMTNSSGAIVFTAYVESV